MFELAGTRYLRGNFELILEKQPPGGAFVRRILGLGTIRGRLIALSFFLVAGFLKAYQQPSRLLLTKGWVNDPVLAFEIQHYSGLVLMAIGLFIYGFVFLFRKHTCRLSFDKTDAAMKFEETPFFAKARVKQRLVPFTDIKEIRVFNDGIQIQTRGHHELDKGFRFRLLSDEQRQFFPLNISRITGLTPVGDWVDPDDQPVSSK
jgi:hypothetical protein